MNQTVAINRAESPDRSRDNDLRSRGDGSFDADLESAQKALAKKNKTPLFAPWAEVQKIFNVLPLEFKFDFDANRVEDRPRSKENPAETKTQPGTSGRKQAIAAETTARQVSYYKVPKETLKEQTPSPLPFYPLPVPGLLWNGMPVQITKADMKMIIDEMVEKAELVKSGRSSELNLRLSYENTGEMFLSFILKNGQVTVSIAAARPETRKSLAESLSELESALKSAKINFKEIRIVEVNNDQHPFARS
jgi:hypothetical protein